MQTTEERQPVQITTRIAADMAERLLAIAASERRSLSNLLTFAVERFIEDYEAKLNAGG